MKSNYFLKHIIGTLVFFSILFISAGRFNYWQGLVYLCIGLVMMSLNYTVLRIDPQLAREREGPGKGTKSWDKKILGLSFLATLLMYVIAGLDSGRFRWSPEFPLWLTLSGIILTAGGQLMFLIAQKQNRFFSSTVRIQTDREHTVCTTGLYQFVRHPGYLGMMLQSAGFPLLFGSLWSLLPVFLSIVLLIVRTKMEDRTLQEELKGYKEYAENTRFRVVPFLW